MSDLQHLEVMREALHQRVCRAAYSHYLRRGHVPRELKELVAATKSFEAFAKYSPDQPRVPAGSPEGGQWTDAGGGRVEPSSVPKEPRGRPNDDIFDPPIEPVYPLEELLITILGGRAVVASARRALTMVGALRAPKVISKVSDIELTVHGSQRFAQRGISESAIRTALNTAKEAGQVTTKIGKYGTPQNVYKGKNGVTVIIETAGRNTGKIITTYYH